MGRRGFTGALATQHGLPVDRYPMTKEEIAIAEEALAADLAKLSMVDQEKILFDIHGLPTTTLGDDYDDYDDAAFCVGEDADEDSNSRVSVHDEKKLKALENELRNIVDDRKSAYERALYLNPEYVKGREFQLGFLQCAENDPILAADQIVQHFFTKQKLFGSGDILGRIVLFSDLTPDAMNWIESGCFQVLPSRDAAGRIVLFSAAGYSQHQQLEDLEDMMRAIWYMDQVVTMSDESVTRDGIIIIEYMVGPYGTIMDMKEMEYMCNHCIDGSCMKVAVGHVCFDDPGMESYIAGVSLFSSEEDRHRIRAHYGTTADILFKLQTFGIPTDEFPINSENTLELGWHREWLACQKKRESLGSDPAISVLVPRRFDVLFGRGESTRVHTGNLRAVHLVEMHFEEYEEASRREKTAIANRVVSKIVESYGRFLKWEEGGWVEVDFDTARDKVSHFFRRRRIRAEKERKTQNIPSDATSEKEKKTNRPEDDQFCSVVNKRMR